ncbi:hypothetical protein AB0442_06350 [Kitasatospora sp. NPDC085895]|uniref:hypothetical protein n=1 Tax=Kitasatospora sp. NPDC085895 TaxID=3155057 RepID=UPI00344D6291
MPRHPGRTTAAVLLAVVAALTASAAPGYAAADPTALCALAQQSLEAGHLAQATALYTQTEDGNPLPCASLGLTLVAAHHQVAAQATAAGQEFLQAGDLAAAERKFREALGNDAENAEAAAGLDAITARQQDLALSRWDLFYDRWVLPMTQLFTAAAILLLALVALSGLLTGVVVKVDSIAWPRPWRISLGIAGYFLLIGSALMFTVYQMFHPFDPGELSDWPADLTVLVVLPTAVTLAAAWTHGRYRFASERESRRQTLGRLFRSWRPTLAGAFTYWGRLLVPLLAVGGLGLLLRTVVLDDPGRRLLTTYAVLALDGILLTAATFGQNLRVQVSVQSPDGENDAVATDYLLARVQDLGIDTPPMRLRAITSSMHLSTIKTEDLSALPNGKIAAALSGLFFAVRPDLTWRVRAAIMDDNRITVTLSRNGRHAESDIFSRAELFLPLSRSEDARERAKAQLLTGAAAVTLLRLSRAHPRLRNQLCGATNWRSVTLQVIATSRSLIDDPGLRTALLARAVDEDPGNILARVDHLWALQDATRHDSYAYRQLADAADEQLAVVKALCPDVLVIRALYRSASQWINRCAATGGRDMDASSKAKRAVEELARKCVETDTDDVEHMTLARQIRPVAEAMEHEIAALSGVWSARRPFMRSAPPPRLAYEYARLAGLDPRRPRVSDRTAIHYLRIALPTEALRAEARKDPCLAGLHDSKEYQELTAAASTFLDLPVFDSCRPALVEAGLSAPTDFLLRTATARQRAVLAEYLDVSPVLVERFVQIAQLTQLHDRLDCAATLGLLVECGIDSPARLLAEFARDKDRLFEAIGDANREGPRIPEVDDVASWLPDAVSTAAAAHRSRRGRRAADRLGRIG